VRVRYGRARHQVVRVERGRAETVVHLAGFFAHAPREIQQALATWMRSGRRAPRATRELDHWIEQRVRALAAAAPREVRLEARGRHHDLARIAAELLGSEFAGDALGDAPAIGWGRARGSRSRRSLRLGSFDPVDRAVRLHPVLDSRGVPEWFVRYVLFHELLHAVLDAPSRKPGRRIVHGPEFRRRERAYRDHSRALEWEKRQIHALIRCARAGEPFVERKTQRKPPERSSWLQKLLF